MSIKDPERASRIMAINHIYMGKCWDISDALEILEDKETLGCKIVVDNPKLLFPSELQINEKQLTFVKEMLKSMMKSICSDLKDLDIEYINLEKEG